MTMQAHSGKGKKADNYSLTRRDHERRAKIQNKNDNDKTGWWSW